MPTREDIIRVAGNFPQMIAYLDASYHYVFANQPYADFISMKLPDIIGKHVTVVTGQDEFERRIKGIFDRAMSGEQQQYDIEYPHAWARVDVIPQTTANGVIGFYIFASDITAIRQAERDSAHYRAVVDSTLDGVIVIDDKGTVQSFNPAAVRLFGYQPHEVVGHNVKMLMPPEHIDRHDGYMLNYMTTGKGRVIGTPGVVADCRRKDGSTFPAELSVAEFTTIAGRAFTSMIRDITERKQWEADLEASKDELEARIEDRTRDLRIAHETLRQSQKMEAIGQLTGGIAHDFNNLLAGIIGSLDILQSRIDSGKITTIDQAKKYTDGAMESAKRAASLTQRMLAFARRQPLENKVIDPNSAVISMEELVSRSIGVEVSFEIVPEATWAIKCDRNQLENAILNLVLNARDATPEGGHICVTTRNTETLETRAYDIPDGEYVRITVSDTGSGMTEDVKNRAFDPFFTTKPIGQGTGLGLSMIYGFVSQSDGHVRIETVLGEGTSIHIFLPREHGALTRASGEGYGPLPEAADVGQVVLVVEDEPLVRIVINETLSNCGFTVLEAEDAYKALDVIKTQQRIDLMVSDVGLPGMNGRQLAEEARTYRPGLGVLFVTGYASTFGKKNDVLQPGMQMMTKPFDVKALAERVIEMVG